ncbi:MAG: primosomal protein N' [Planctomycetes bacterium]|nr:primosomal protein N' [Planctomycetota bacterium]
MASGPDKSRPAQLWLLPEQGRAGRHLVADVAIDAPVMRTYSYSVPDELRDRVHAGVRVRGPHRGKNPVEGICVRIADRPWDHTLRPLVEVLSGDTPLTEPLIDLGLWMADYYHCSPLRALRALAPAPAWDPPKIKTVKYVRLAAQLGDGSVTDKQRSLLGVVAEGSSLRRRDALRRAAVGPSTLASLCKRGLIEQYELQVPEDALPSDDELRSQHCATSEDGLVLNADQQRALHQIDATSETAPEFRVFLLFGVPGSGKTEVYVRAARRTIAAGRQVIIIVPEIALATHLVDRLVARFDRVRVLHSRLSPRERTRSLRAIHSGGISVVIGTRTAVFAPCPQLGLIVVDEEQEASLKNQMSPRYHARDTAIKRAELENIPIVLGTATPSLETWHNAAVLRHYCLLRLPERAGGAQPPRVRLVTDRAADRDGPATLLSKELRAALRDTLDAKEQAILLHNRRGYAAHLRCGSCGLTAACDRCGSHLVYHRTDQNMKCHLCGSRSPVPKRCPDTSCGGRLERTGMAIQRLEEELTRAFPAARLLRLDSDTMRRREDYRSSLERFERREADFLIGTQMVAKGLDFAGVRLVGVIEADAALTMPDFRAAERTFQLVAQVVGRAGRRAGGSQAIVQSSTTSLGVVRYALTNDYESFAAEELERRRRLFYPPFSRLIRCVCSDPQPSRARRAAETLAEALRRCGDGISGDIQFSEAQPCVIRRQRDLFRFQVLIRAPRDGSAQRLLHDAAAGKHLFVKAARLTIDVDPIDLM